MSFDMKLVNGDLVFDDQGRFLLVRDSNKLVQDVLKLISTAINADPFDPGYGISVTANSVGQATTASLPAAALESEIFQGIQRLQQEQIILERTQVITPAERIRNIDRVDVEQDAQEPRQYNIFIELTTGDATPTTVTAQIRA